VSDYRPTARTAFKLVAKVNRPLVILGAIMDDTFDDSFENVSEESEIRRSIGIQQEIARKAISVLRRLLAKLL
jgi:hypothetical protein